MAKGTRRSEEGQESTSQEVAKAIKTEAVNYVAKAVIATAVGIVSIAGVGLWIFVKQFLPELAGGVPRGAVVAFDRDDFRDGGEHKCPPGWSRFLEARARTIVGAGDTAKAPLKLARDEKDKPLIGYVLGQHGGTQVTQLTIGEMPRHSHKLRRSAGGGNNNFPVYGGELSADPPTGMPETSLEGDGNAFTNMPPFIALFYCKRD